MSGEARDALAAALGRAPLRLAPMSGGCIAEVYRAEFADGTRAAVKWSAEGGLECEAFMLRYLRRHGGLPVPDVLHGDGRLLVLEYIEHDGGLARAGEREAGRLVAALHAVRGPRFGFERDTVIGPLPQPNPGAGRWLPFFRDHRLLHMADQAHRAGRLPAKLRGRIDALAARLDDLVQEPAHPALLHGDLWPGNVLAAADPAAKSDVGRADRRAPGRRGRVAAFIDPAIYWGHPEMDLAFAGLFAGLGEDFLAGYAEVAPIAPGFREVRRDLYNLWPLLVHVRLFGGFYVGRVERIVARFGC
ncbi:MAG: fructosamine kinase family protein [Alphaproteobacteria bacterium]|nr:fructosamine kinase family protein [Alphaproteobacteria bacterium]